MRLVLLGGFLGAGKTTTMLAAARLLQRHGRNVAVVTNDQGEDLVDSERAKAAGFSAAEVTGGCFCCRFEDLTEVITQITAGGGVDTVLAEAVGSCTDLQATVVRPLRRVHRLTVAPLTTIVDPSRLRSTVEDGDLGYLYGRQLAEADILALNKSDLLDRSEGARLEDDLCQRFPYARVHAFSARTGSGLDRLVSLWERRPPAERDVEVDYDRYAAAEAALAWLNQHWEVRAANGTFSPIQWAEHLLMRVSHHGYEIGHAKVFARTSTGAVAMSVVVAGGTPQTSLVTTDSASVATVSLNVRAVCSPDELSDLVSHAVALADASTETVSVPGPAQAFRPAYPKPVHRMATG